MEATIHRKGLINWWLLGALGAATVAVARYAHSAAGLVGAVFLGLGFLVAAVSYLQMRLEERERLEQMEFDELKKRAGSASLFAEQAVDTFPARRAREQFGRFFVPVFAMVLLLAEGVAVYLLWQHLSNDLPAPPERGTVAMALYGLFALLAFQFGKYSAVLARLQAHRLLRPQASYLLLGALLSLVSALVEVAAWAGYPGVDLVVARLLVVVLGLVALESLLRLVFEIYRPRVKGQAALPLYESRLLGLLSQPGGLITTAAQALDYQFGFKVSETWFYRFLEQALARLVLIQLAVVLVSTMFVVIEPGEQGLLERFGRPAAGQAVLDPGLHLKLPWPISRVYRYQTDRIQSFTIGVAHDEHEDDHDTHGSPAPTASERVMIWSKPHHAKEEFNLLVASRTQDATNRLALEQTVPVNLLAVNIPVQYQVSNLRDFAYQHVNGGELLERLAYGEVTRYLVSVDLDDIMAAGRQQAAEDLRARIQARADEFEIGVTILFVGLHEIHPPVKVAPDFERVIGALQERAATNLFARGYAATNVPVAKGQAARKLNEALAYQTRVTAVAEGAAGRFTNQMAAAQASPEVYRLRTYLDTLSRSIGSSRKYVLVPTNVQDVVTLNLEDKLRPDLLDVPVPVPRN